MLVDRPDHGARFLLLGSASPALTKGVSESLAGRVGLVDLAGFNLQEVGASAWRTLWLRGGFPRSYLAPNLKGSVLWRESFARTFLERDVPQLGITVPAETLRRFWTMIAHYHGQVWNAAEFARALGASEGTARRYLDILAGAFMVRVLPPWFENLKKRQVKSPRIYVRDTGLLHTLLDLAAADDLAGHPKVGHRSKGSPSSRCSLRSRRPMRISGRPMPARSSTCSSPAAGSATASNASSAMRRERRGRRGAASAPSRRGRSA